MELQERVLAGIRAQGLIEPGSTVVVGVSGGVDSMVLAHLMAGLRHPLSLRVHVAHFNHRLRKNAEGDEQLVRRTARDLRIPITVGRRSGRVDVSRVSEDTARAWRFQFFQSTLQKVKGDMLALAHTQNDVAETVLMRIIRGAGLNGLQGIRPARLRQGVHIVRPLLDVTRKDIEVYAGQHGIAHHEDETNADTKFLRNKVRLKLLPLLAKDYNPQIYSTLSALAQTVGEDYEFLQEEARQRIKENVVSLKGTVTIKAGFLARQPASMQRLILRYAFEQLTGDLNQLTFAHIAQAEAAIARSAERAVVHWPQNVRLFWRHSHVVLTHDP